MKVPAANSGRLLACSTYIRESGGEECADWAVVCHGVLATRQHSLIQAVAKCVQNHMNVITFDFHHNGESEESPTKWSMGDYDVEAYDDLEGIIQYLRNDGKNVKLIIGHSRGANVVLMHAAKFDSVPFVVSLAARFTMGAGLENLFSSKEEMERVERGEVPQLPLAIKTRDMMPRIVTTDCLARRKAIDMGKLLGGCALVGTKIIFLAHGEADETIPVNDVEGLASAIPLKEKRIIRRFEEMKHDMKVDGSYGAICDWLSSEVCKKVLAE